MLSVRRPLFIAVSAFSLSSVALPLLAADEVAQDSSIETIEVSGVSSSLKSDLAEMAATPGGVTIVDIERLREGNVSNLADVLRYVPGVWSTSDSGSDGIFFSSRGSNLDATDFDMNGIKLLQDGLPVTTADGNNHNRIIDPLSTRYAVFARGANGIKYGASTLGGAVNFVSPTAHDISGAEVFFSTGSHGQQLSRVTLGKVFNDKVDGLVTIENKEWDGFRDHNEQDRHGLYANLGLKLSEALSTRFFATYLHNDQEIAGSLSKAQFDDDPDQSSENGLGGNFQLDVESWRIANKTTWQIDENRRLEFGVSLEKQELFHPIVDQVFVDFDGPGPGAPVEVFSLLIDTDHQDIGAMIRYQQQWGNHDLLLGINYGENEVKGDHFRNLGGRRNGLMTLINNEATSLEAYILDRWRFRDQWTLVFGLQGVSASRDIRNTDAESGELRDPDDDYSSINPRLGLIYQPSDNVSLFANVSHLFEAPTNFELEDELTASDATLDAMHGTVFEIGTRGQQALAGEHQWHWDVTAYYAEIRDEILSVDDPEAPGTSLATNVDDTVHAGIEAVLGATFLLSDNAVHQLAPLISLTYNDFEFDGDAIYGDNKLPAAPGHAIRGEIIYRHQSGFYAGPTFDIVDERFADFANNYEIDAYNLVGFRTGWTDDQWRVFVEGRNLLDKEFVANHGVRDVADVDAEILNPGEPRSVYVGVQVRF